MHAVDPDLLAHLARRCADPRLAAQLAYILQHGEIAPHVGAEPSKRSKRTERPRLRGAAFFDERTKP